MWSVVSLKFRALPATPRAVQLSVRDTPHSRHAPADEGPPTHDLRLRRGHALRA